MSPRNTTNAPGEATANNNNDTASNTNNTNANTTTELFKVLPNPPSHFSIESDLADELLKLSFQDRVAIQEEMHGVRCRAADETPELLEEALSKFDTLILEKKLALEYELQQQQQLQLQQQLEQQQLQPQQHSPQQQQKPQTTTPTKKRKNLLRNVRHISIDQQKQQLDAANFANFASTPEPGKPPSTNSNKANVNSNKVNTIHNKVNTIHNNYNKNHTLHENYCYLNDPNVRLRFLRSERFDVPKAVQRFCGFLELTEELFGDYVAERPIRITDFNTRKEEVGLQNSRNQYLPFRDRSGRRVFCCVGHCGYVGLGPALLYKTMTFLHWVASEDIETQQKGAVFVIWPTDEEATNNTSSTSNSNSSNSTPDNSWEKSIRPKLSTKIRRLHQQLTDSMPLRVTSRHAYYKDTPFFRTISALYYIGMNSHQKSVYKAHYGEPTELRYAFTSYGLPEQLLPLSHTGTVKTANHSRWINALRAKEEREQRKHGNTTNHNNNVEEPIVVDCPGSRDVIFRKGPTYKNNPGNMFFRELIESTHDSHTKGTRKEKCTITWRIVREIEANNGRFLDWSQSREMWVVATDRDKIRKKVAACYKQYNRTISTFQQQQQQQQQQPMKPMKQTPQKQIATRTATPNAGSTVHKNVDRGLRREYYKYDNGIPSTKRRKTFSIFCGTAYSSSSDSEDCGCGFPI